jgi:mRNA interferase RelE/StbE
MNWTVKYLPEADDDYDNCTKSQKYQIDKAIQKVSQNPLPQSEGGYGKPLGNKRGRNLTGLLKIKLKKLGIRVVYKLVRTGTAMQIVVVAVRADEEVYEIAARRTGRA